MQKGTQPSGQGCFCCRMQPAQTNLKREQTLSVFFPRSFVPLISLLKKIVSWNKPKQCGPNFFCLQRYAALAFKASARLYVWKPVHPSAVHLDLLPPILPKA